jgi:DNA repair protein RadC
MLLSGQEWEYFVVVASTTFTGVLASEILFTGTIDGARVYPREVVKCALSDNAAAVILAHINPSGVLESRQVDELITRPESSAFA